MNLNHEQCLLIVAAMFEETVEDLRGERGRLAHRDALEWVMSDSLDAWVAVLPELEPFGVEAVRRGLLARGGVSDAEAARYRWERTA